MYHPWHLNTFRRYIRHSVLTPFPLLSFAPHIVAWSKEYSSPVMLKQPLQILIAKRLNTSFHPTHPLLPLTCLSRASAVPSDSYTQSQSGIAPWKKMAAHKAFSGQPSLKRRAGMYLQPEHVGNPYDRLPWCRYWSTVLQYRRNCTSVYAASADCRPKGNQSSLYVYLDCLKRCEDFCGWEKGTERSGRYQAENRRMVYISSARGVGVFFKLAYLSTGRLNKSHQ
jgi:hypothetical protein